MDFSNLHTIASNCSLSSDALFDNQYRQKDIVQGMRERVNPTTSVQCSRVIEFLVKGNEAFIDLHNCYLQTKIIIK